TGGRADGALLRMDRTAHECALSTDPLRASGWPNATRQLSSSIADRDGGGRHRHRRRNWRQLPRHGPGICAPRNSVHAIISLLKERKPMNAEPLRVGIGGPVGSGKTALLLALCRAMRDDYNIAVVTNDIYTREDAEFLTRNEALSQDRIMGVETG